MIPLGVSADLQSAVKKRPNLFELCGFAIRIKQDLKIYVVAAAVGFTSALAGSAVILVGLAASALTGTPASTLVGTTSARCILRSAAIGSRSIVIVCYDLGELLQLGVALGLRVSHNQVYALHASRRYLLLAHLAT